jgi:hypothetical protein
MTTFQALHASNDAPWVQRFRAPTVLWTGLAKAKPTRGVAASNQSGFMRGMSGSVNYAS